MFLEYQALWPDLPRCSNERIRISLSSEFIFKYVNDLLTWVNFPTKKNKKTYLVPPIWTEIRSWLQYKILIFRKCNCTTPWAEHGLLVAFDELRGQPRVWLWECENSESFSTSTNPLCVVCKSLVPRSSPENSDRVNVNIKWLAQI